MLVRPRDDTVPLQTILLHLFGKLLLGHRLYENKCPAAILPNRAHDSLVGSIRHRRPTLPHNGRLRSVRRPFRRLVPVLRGEAGRTGTVGPNLPQPRGGHQVRPAPLDVRAAGRNLSTIPHCCSGAWTPARAGRCRNFRHWPTRPHTAAASTPFGSCTPTTQTACTCAHVHTLQTPLQTRRHSGGTWPRCGSCWAGA